MTVKEILLIFWVFGVMVITLFIRHFLGDAVYLLEHFVAFGLGSMPSLTQFVAGHLR